MATLPRSCGHIMKSSKWMEIAVTSRHKSSTVGTPGVATDFETAIPFSDIPGPKGVPWFGQWLEYKLKPDKVNRRDLVLKEFNARYGDIVKETVAGKNLIHLFSLDYIRQIYETETKYPMIPPLLESVEFYRKTKELAPGLGNSNGEDWYRLRTVVQHIMLRTQKSLDYLPAQNKVAGDFVGKIRDLMAENGEIPNFNHWIARWGLESAANNCFDKRMGFMDERGLAEGDKIIETNNELFDLSIKLHFSLPLYKYFPTPGVKKLFELEDFISSKALEYLKSATAEYEKLVQDGTLTDDRFRFLSYMLSSKHVKYEDVSIVVISVLTDTLSTTTQTLLCNLYTLASNPEAQEKAYEEAMKLLTPDGELTANGFNSSTYIKACIKETFRLFPIGLDVQRLSPSNMVIGGYQIPEGSYLCLNSYVRSQDPEYIPEPDMFSPDRWLRDESAGKKIDPYLLTPFSLGRRMCAGRRFAEQELVLMIAKILRNYRLEWHYGKVHQRYRLLLIPDQEIKVKFIPRNK